MAVPLFVFQDYRYQQTKTRRTLESFSDSQIRDHCGLRINDVRQLVDLNEPISGKISTSLPLDTKVLIFVSQLRSRSFQWIVGTSCGASQATVSRVINDCTDLTLGFAKKVIDFQRLKHQLN
jgi:hypothetical protein